MSFLNRFRGGAERAGGASVGSVSVGSAGPEQEAMREANMIDYYARSGMPAEALAGQLMESCGGDVAKVERFLGEISAKRQVIAAKAPGR